MAITFDIANTEIVITSGQTSVTAQELVNAIAVFQASFQMMSNPIIAEYDGKIPLGGGVFTEIVLVLLNDWTIRFEDEGVAHTSIDGGTFQALDEFGDPRPVTTNPALTIRQSISGTLIEGSGGGGDWTDAEKEQIRSALGVDGDKTAAVGGQLQTALLDLLLVKGLLHNNAMIDNQVYVSGRPTSARVRVFDSPANVPASSGGSETTGLVAEFQMESEYDGDLNSTKYVLKQVLP